MSGRVTRALKHRQLYIVDRHLVIPSFIEIALSDKILLLQERHNPTMDSPSSVPTGIGKAVIDDDTWRQNSVSAAELMVGG